MRKSKTLKSVTRSLVLALALTGAGVIGVQQAPEASAAPAGWEFTREKAKQICGPGYVPKQSERLQDRYGNYHRAYIWVLKNSDVDKYCAVNIGFGSNYGSLKQRDISIRISAYDSKGNFIRKVRQASTSGRFSYYAGPIKIDYGSLRSQYPAASYRMVAEGLQGAYSSNPGYAELWGDLRYWPRLLADSMY